MKKVNNILGRLEASLNGSLDGLQLDNTADVIEKSLVIEMVNDLKMLVNEAQTEVKNISSNAVLADILPDLEEKRRNITESYIETHCLNYTDKEKVIARNMMHMGWIFRANFR